MDDALDDYSQALAIAPEDRQIQLEWRRTRGRRHVERLEWREASLEFVIATELQPNDSYLWRNRAVTQFLAQDCEAYKLTCRVMLDHFGNSQERIDAANLLLSCTLMDDALTDSERLLNSAETARAIWHWGSWVRGATLYRARRYQECIECFEAAANRYHARAWDLCFLAMAYHRLGEHQRAQECIEKAQHWIATADARDTEDLTDTQPTWGSWHERSVYPRLLMEAEELLANDAANAD
jgi:tetratricopeptide (TPR) repeat protein